MSENRFVAEQVDVVNEDETEVWDIVFDTENTYAFMVRDTDTASGLCDLLNEQQSKIKELEKKNKELKIKYTNRGIAITKAVEDLHRKEEVYLADFDICKRITEYEWEFNNE